MSIKDKLRGVLGFPLTPFNTDLSLNLEALEKTQTAINAVRKARTKQRMFQYPRLRIRAVQQRHVRKGHAFAVQRSGFINDKLGFVFIR